MDSNSKKYVTISILAFVCYCNTLWGTFVFDDSEAIIKNKDVKPDSPIAQIFENDFWGTNISLNSSHKSYRPLTVLSYRLNVIYSMNKLDAFQFHATNVILYGILCLLTIPIFELFIKKKKYESSMDDVALTASVLFTVHPIHTEAVAGLVGRADILSSILFLVILLCYQSLIKKSFLLWFCFVFTLTTCAVLCKETAITVLGACLIYDVYKSKKRRKSWYKSLCAPMLVCRVICLFIIGLIIMYYRLKIMMFEGPTFSKTDNPAAFADEFYVRILTYNYIYSLNALLLLWPQWLCFDWSMGCVPLIYDISDYRVIQVLLFWGGCASIFIVLIRKSLLFELIDIRIVVLSLVILPLIPASNILFHVGFVIAERTLLLPSTGFCFLIALGFKKLKTRYSCEKLFVVAYILLCFTFAIRTIQRNSEWLSEDRLFKSALAVCPNNAKVHYNMAKVAADAGRRIDALQGYRKAIELYPDYEQAMNNLANLLREDKKFQEAEELLRKAVKVRPNFAAAWMNLGIVLTNLNKLEEAEKCYMKAISHRKRYPDCYYNLGNLYLDQGRHREALQSWRMATILKPTLSAAWGNTLALLDTQGRLQDALRIGTDALRYNPDAHALHFALGNALGKLKRFDEAEKRFLKAIKLNPQNALYYSNLGVLYHRWDKPKEARQMYARALEIDSNLKSAEMNLKKLPGDETAQLKPV
ncbi:protein O-mannosyl-transferase TMTC4 [Cylas formicarius]|uniref:protein O-mannosyl-transferase TMTC4 n=1 Tax=Cylas formicarius TaxID=197179 RepID=UPI002958AE3C|nr:protein O-mannosyl-transferase TMTC4 [Cylas formicarius]